MSLINYSDKNFTYYSHVRKDLVPFLPNGLKRVLDVGCSNGSFGQMLKRDFGVQEVWGIEPFEYSAKESLTKLDYVINSSIEDSITELPDFYFDCIFFNDVLEHLVDPYSILKQLKVKLVNHGYIFSSIPNVLHFETLYNIILTQDWRYEDAGILDKTHLRFFTKKSIIRMFEESGYKVESINGINPYYGKKFSILKFLLGKKVKDFSFIQFVALAKVRNE